MDVPFSLSRFPLWAPEPQVPAAGSPGRRGFENHRPKTDHTNISSLSPVLLRVLRTPDTPHTYVYTLSLSLWLKRLPLTSSYTLVFASFRTSLSDFMVQQNSVSLRLNFQDLLSFVSSINWEYDNPESEPQEPGHRRQKPGPA